MPVQNDFEDKFGGERQFQGYRIQGHHCEIAAKRMAKIGQNGINK